MGYEEGYPLNGYPSEKIFVSFSSRDCLGANLVLCLCLYHTQTVQQLINDDLKLTSVSWLNLFNATVKNSFTAQTSKK